MKSKPQSVRRKAKTARGVDVASRVVEAAKTLLSENWLDHISISKLAREAGIARASLLLQFPNGWPDVANWIVVQEFGDEHLNWLYDLAEKHTKRPVNDRLFEALDFILMRAESAGLLYPNLRSQMFVWGEENAGVMRCLLIDVLDAMVEMMKQAAPKGSEQSCMYAAEVLFGTALDLAATPGLHYRTFKERREALRNTIDLTVAGLAST